VLHQILIPIFVFLQGSPDRIQLRLFYFKNLALLLAQGAIPWLLPKRLGNGSGGVNSFRLAFG